MAESLSGQGSNLVSEKERERVGDIRSGELLSCGVRICAARVAPLLCGVSYIPGVTY